MGDSKENMEGDEIIESESLREPVKNWININNEYILPRSFLENCVVYIQRSGSTLVIRTTEEHNDLTLVLQDAKSAVETMLHITALLETERITCNIEFAETENA